MTIVVNNPFGQDGFDFNEETSANRIGNRIRAIRIEKGLSQAELGAVVSLTGDRIQKYENGVRKPKIDLLKQIAAVLEVEVTALMDPVVSNYIGAMYAFFEMEQLYELEVIKEADMYRLQFGDGVTGTLNKYLKEWYLKRETTRNSIKNASEEEKKVIVKEYHEWEHTFPQSLGDSTEKAMKKARLKNTIAELQEELDKLDED